MGSSTMEVKLVVGLLLFASVCLAQENDDRRGSTRLRLKALFNRRRIEEGNENEGPKRVRSNILRPRLQKEKEEVKDLEEEQVVSVSVSTSESVSISKQRPVSIRIKKPQHAKDDSANEIRMKTLPTDNELSEVTENPTPPRRFRFRKNRINDQRDLIDKLLSRVNDQKQVAKNRIKPIRPRKFTPSNRREKIRKNVKKVVFIEEEIPAKLTSNINRVPEVKSEETNEKETMNETAQASVVNTIETKTGNKKFNMDTATPQTNNFFIKVIDDAVKVQSQTTSPQRRRIARPRRLNSLGKLRIEPRPTKPTIKSSSFTVREFTTEHPITFIQSTQLIKSKENEGTIEIASLKNNSEPKNKSGLDSLKRLQLIAQTHTSNLNPSFPRSRGNTSQQRRKPSIVRIQEIETSVSDKVKVLPSQPIKPAFLIDNIPSNNQDKINRIELPRATVEDTKPLAFKVQFQEINSNIDESFGKQTFVPRRQPQISSRQRLPQNIITKRPQLKVVLTERSPIIIEKIEKNPKVITIQRSSPVESKHLPTFAPFKFPDFFTKPFSNPNLEQNSIQQSNRNGIFNTVGVPTGQIGVVQGHPQAHNLNINTGSYSFFVGL